MATYYVSTTGNNTTGTGTISSPWATINYAWSQVTNNSDDIIYVRGGTYTYSMLGITNLTNKNGVDANNRLQVLNYPDEIPIIDFTDYLGSSATGIIEVENCNYLHLRGFELKHNLQLQSTARLGYGIRVKERVNYSLFERLNVHHCGGWGIVVSAGSATSGNQSCNNTFYRCDSHHHSDRYSSSPWEGSDGFLINSYSRLNPANRSLNLFFIECRAWMNSDDGWDNRLCNATIFYDKCWAFWNGFEPGETDEDTDSFVHPSGGGDGYGFKLGSRYDIDSSLVERTVTRCISFENYHTGFQHSHGTGTGTYDGIPYQEADSGAVVYNCTAYGNGNLGFNFGTLDVATDILRNCLSYGTTSDYDFVVAAADDTYNASNSTYWYQRNFSCQSADFESLDSSGVDGSRGPNGELPTLTFLRLASNSDLIDAGIDVGLAFSGNEPDIGAFEYEYVDSSVGVMYLTYNGKLLTYNGKYLVYGGQVTYIPSLEISPEEMNFAGNGDACETSTISITVANGAQSWIITGNNEWCTLSKTSGSGNDTVTVMCSMQSSGGSSRNTTLAVSSGTLVEYVSVTQNAYGVGCA